MSMIILDNMDLKARIKNAKQNTIKQNTVKQNIIEHKQEIRDELARKFNMVILNMINHLTEYYCDVNALQLKFILENIIIGSPEEPISCFLLKVYKNDDYRINILAQNDKFFMDELDNSSDDTISEYEQDQDTMDKLFEFKSLWQQIDNATKDFIKKSMMTLVRICDHYIPTL